MAAVRRPGLSAPGDTRTTRLVGRDKELEAVRAKIESGPAAGLVTVVLTGEGGIGKSRLLAEVVDGIVARGWHVLSARADELERQIPYAALVRMVTSAEDHPDPEIAGLAAELIATLDVLGASSRHDVESSFGQVCGQATRLIQALLERKPLALVIDDLHALDDDALALLAIVLRRVATGRIAFLAASRLALPTSSPALDALFTRLDAENALNVIAVTPLDEAAVGELVAPILGDDASLAREVSASAEGNPFFALEIAASMLDAPGKNVNRANAVLRRFVPLDPPARSILRAIAVLGRVDVDDLDVLAAITSLDVDAVASAFDRLVNARLLHPADGGYDFVHHIVREAVYEDIGPAERRQLHCAVAELLLANRAAGRKVDLMALARHLSESAMRGDATAVEVIAEAADRARAIAPGSAAALYGRALELAPEDDTVRARLLSRRCRAFAIAAQPAEAVAAGRTALELFAVGEPERSRTATAVIGSLFELGTVEEALAVADAEVASGDAGAVIVAQRPILLWFAGRRDEAMEEWDRVRALPVANDAERILVLGQHAMSAATFYDHPTLLAITDELERLAERAPSTLRLYGIAIAAYTLAMDACSARALPLIQRAESMLDDAGGTPFRGNILVARVMADWMQGRWDEAIDGAATGAAELEGAQLAVHLGAFHAAEIDIRANRGEPIAASLLEFEPPTPNLADLLAYCVAGLHESRGDLDAARATIKATLEVSGSGAAYMPLLQGRLVEIAIATERKDDAETALAELEKGAVGLSDPWSGTLRARCRALVSGDLDAAREAVAIADAGGMPFERARSQLVVGELDSTATEPLVESYRTFQSLGADRYRRKSAALLAARGAKIPRQRSQRSGLLTKAEMAIARLVQQGMRNKEIATFLHYSPRTVEVYLSRIYNKLAVSSRLELARALDARAFDT